MALRNYSNAPSTALNGAITNSATAINVDSVTGMPVSFPYPAIIDRGQATEEVVDVTGGTGVNLTIVRGVDSTTAFAHGDNTHAASSCHFKTWRRNMRRVSSGNLSHDCCYAWDGNPKEPALLLEACHPSR